MPTPTLRYDITPIDPHAHLFEVRCTVDKPDPEGQRFAMPAWIPGSYMIRDFAKHIVSIHAEAAGRKCAITQEDKHTWRVARARGPVTVVCRVYALDLSVRGAHLDASHAFFNGTSVFLRVLGQEDSPVLVDIRPPAGAVFRDWRVATTLPVARGTRGAAKVYGFGLYRAESYDELIDHPVEMGRFTLASFTACGVRHDIAITGRHDCDTARLIADLERICQWQIRLFGEPPPFDRYLFLVMAVGDGYGGLEHRASTALLCSRNDLPYSGMAAMTESYRTFLGLCSHEYFHAWNVKRIKPAAFMPYALERENHTGLLWAFEGFTSYYDDLALLRSGVILSREYLDLLQKSLGNLARTPGRLHQSVERSSFNAWTQYYRQDENSPNAIVSYYLKGSLIALCLDCLLRAGTRGRVSLDDVMRELWVRFGKVGVGVGEDDIRRLAESLSGLDLKRFFKSAVSGTDELPIEAALSPFGVRVSWSAKSATPTLGIKLASGEQARLATVFEGGPAQIAGLSAGDVLVAIDGLRVTSDRLDAVLSRRRVGERIEIHAFRRDELLCLNAVLAAPPKDECALSLAERASAASRKLRRDWLGA